MGGDVALAKTILRRASEEGVGLGGVGVGGILVTVRCARPAAAAAAPADRPRESESP